MKWLRLKIPGHVDGIPRIPSAPKGHHTLAPRNAWGMGTTVTTKSFRPEGAEYFLEGLSGYPKFLLNGMAPIVAMFFFRLPFRQRIEVWIGFCSPHALRGATIFLSFGQNVGWGTGVFSPDWSFRPVK